MEVLQNLDNSPAQLTIINFAPVRVYCCSRMPFDELGTCTCHDINSILFALEASHHTKCKFRHVLDSGAAV
jgi:hypothetical protein